MTDAVTARPSLCHCFHRCQQKKYNVLVHFIINFLRSRYESQLLSQSLRYMKSNSMFLGLFSFCVGLFQIVSLMGARTLEQEGALAPPGK